MNESAKGLVRLGVAAAMGLAVALSASTAGASLLLANVYNGNVGLSVDAVGSNNTPVGNLQAEVPVTATVLQAYLYAAGTPFPWYPNSPTSLADYNGAGITLDGTGVTNFDHLVGAISTPRPDIGQWFTGRADVTGIVNSYRTANPGTSLLQLGYAEGAALNNRIDGGVLVVVYQDAGLPNGSVVILDGGQDTGGETSTVNFASPIGDPTDPGFVAEMSLAISFSTGIGQASTIDVNGTRMTSAAGGADDGGFFDGGLITAGGIGDSNANPADPASASSPDDELYDLRPFLATGDTSFSIFSNNPSADDNIFFMGLRITADVASVVTPGTRVSEPSLALVLGLGIIVLGTARRRVRKYRAAYSAPRPCGRFQDGGGLAGPVTG